MVGANRNPPNEALQTRGRQNGTDGGRSLDRRGGATLNGPQTSPRRVYESAHRGWSADRLLLGTILLVTLALLIPSAQSLVFLFGRMEFYAHGYLMPLVAGYLAFLDRDRIEAALRCAQPPRAGALVVLLAGVVLLLSLVGDVRTLVGLGIPLLLGAVAYGVGGAPLIRPLAFPLGFLALMVPPPSFVVDRLLVELKLVVTRVAVELLHWTGTTVYAEGNRIEVPGLVLFVADACSGLTSIVTLLPIAVVVAFFVSHGWWRRCVVVLGVIPLAMAFNVMRVFATVKLVDRIGPQAAQGLLHEGFGFATYAVGTVFLVLLARLLR